MIRCRPALLLVGVVAAWALAARATAPASPVWHDVLDTPAVQSPHASRSLLNGLARAGRRIVAVGQRGHVLTSDDGGHDWQQAQVPVSSDLVAVSFGDATHGWAVGHDGVVLSTTDAGHTWTRQLDGRRLGETIVGYYQQAGAAALAADPKRADAAMIEVNRFAAQGAENSFLDVWFKDASTGYAVGAFGLILRTTDGGAHWEPLLHAVDNPKGLHLYAVRGIGADVYIVGEQGLVLKLDAASGRFRALGLPYNGTLFGIVGNERAVIVHGLRGTALRSTDGGRSWQSVTTGLQAGLTASTLAEDGRFIIASQAGHVIASSDDGASFTQIKIAQPLPAAGVTAAGKGELVVAGPRGAASLTLP
jgi:photosystem II stability/assembly factor-like uncharacterized protein